MSDIEVLLDRENEIAGAVNALVEIINAGRIAAEDKQGLGMVLDVLYRQYNEARARTHAHIVGN